MKPWLTLMPCPHDFATCYHSCSPRYRSFQSVASCYDLRSFLGVFSPCCFQGYISTVTPTYLWMRPGLANWWGFPLGIPSSRLCPLRVLVGSFMLSVEITGNVLPALYFPRYCNKLMWWNIHIHILKHQLCAVCCPNVLLKFCLDCLQKTPNIMWLVDWSVVSIHGSELTGDRRLKHACYPFMTTFFFFCEVSANFTPCQHPFILSIQPRRLPVVSHLSI